MAQLSSANTLVNKNEYPLVCITRCTFSYFLAVWDLDLKGKAQPEPRACIEPKTSRKEDVVESLLRASTEMSAQQQ